MQSNIAGLANLFAGTLVALSVVICGGGFILVLVVLSEGQTQIAIIIFALGVLAIVGLGASAVLVDIMYNVRSLAGSSDAGKAASKQPPHNSTWNSPLR
jgi:hypothetical protein